MFGFSYTFFLLNSFKIERDDNAKDAPPRAVKKAPAPVTICRSETLAKLIIQPSPIIDMPAPMPAVMTLQRQRICSLKPKTPTAGNKVRRPIITSGIAK